MSDQELEALIDKAGRDRVFALAQANGWVRGSIPPRFVWIQICNGILRQHINDSKGDKHE